MYPSVQYPVPYRVGIGWRGCIVGAVIWGITMLVLVTPRACNEIGESQQLSRQGEYTTGTVVANEIRRFTRNCHSFTAVRYVVESKAYELQSTGGCNVPEEPVGASVQVVYLSSNPNIANASVDGHGMVRRFTRLRLILLWATVIYLALLSRQLWKIRLRSADYWFRYEWGFPIDWNGLIFPLLHIAILFFGLVNLGEGPTGAHFIYFIVFFSVLLAVQYAKSEPKPR
jgi:hypothetical protein